jgi:hypothetical protein
LPPLVVVSICSVRLLKPIPRSCSPEIVSIKVWERSPEPIELPDDEGVPAAGEAYRLVETRSVRLGAAGGIGEQPLTPGLLQRVLLERERLIVGRDPGIPNKHAPIVSESVCEVIGRAGGVGS